MISLRRGRKICVLTVVDTFLWYVPVLDTRFNYNGEDVVLTLHGVCRHIDYPKTIAIDNGSEFISQDMDLCELQLQSAFEPNYRKPAEP